MTCAIEFFIGRDENSSQRCLALTIVKQIMCLLLNCLKRVLVQ